MEKVRVKLGTIDNVKEFNNAATSQSFDIDIVSGRYVIDAKSIMGIFSIDLTKVLEVNIHAGKEEAEDFLKAIDKMIVK